MIEIKAADDLFTEPNEPKVPKPEPKKPINKADLAYMAEFMHDYYKSLVKAGFTKKDALELSKSLIDSCINGTTKTMGGISKWIL